MTGHSLEDSVRIILAPGASRLAVHLAGALRGDFIVGRWRADAFGAGGGAGEFLMRRQASNP